MQIWMFKFFFQSRFVSSKNSPQSNNKCIIRNTANTSIFFKLSMWFYRSTALMGIYGINQAHDPGQNYLAQQLRALSTHSDHLCLISSTHITWQVIFICYFKSLGLNDLLWPLWRPPIHWCINIHAGKIFMHLK